MKLVCNPQVGEHLRSSAQKAREISEAWFGSCGYCLACGSERVDRMKAGTVAWDAVCPQCSQRYELKSKATVHGRIVQDGGYDAMMAAMKSGHAPALMLMQYTRSSSTRPEGGEEWRVRNLVALHPVFFTPEIVRRRPKPHIRRPSGAEYWMCDLDISRIPADGKIVVVRDGVARPHAEPRREFKTSVRFKEISLRSRGWAALTLAKVRQLGKQEFTLAEMYAFENEMHAAYPQNSHVRDKIRQQMQVLRDLGYVEFVGRGEYRVVG